MNDPVTTTTILHHE